MADLGKEIVYPADETAERAVIASVLIDNRTLDTVADLVQPLDFYSEIYEHMYQAMISLKRDGLAIDTVTLERRLRDLNICPDGYDVIVGRLLRDSLSSVHADDYAHIVREKATLRRLMRMCEQGKERCKTGASAKDVLESLERDIYRLSTASTGTTMVDMHEEGMAYLQSFEARKACKNGLIGLRTGLRDLDKMLHGLQKRKLYVIGARPSMGKSALSMTIAHYVAMHEHQPTLMFPIVDMDREEIYDRLESIHTHIPRETLTTATVTAEQQSAIYECVDEIDRTELYIEMNKNELSDIRRLSRLYKTRHGIQLIIIDYFQLLRDGGSGNSSNNRYQELSNISCELKLLASELDVPIVLLAQLNRNKENEQDKRPMMSDLRDCGSLEQDADVVILLYRHEYYDKDDADCKGVAELLVRKQRGGETGDVIVAWQPQRSTFVNLRIQNGRSVRNLTNQRNKYQSKYKLDKRTVMKYGRKDKS